MTWNVFKSDIGPGLKRSAYYREVLRYYWIKFLLFLYRIKIRFIHSLGYKVSEDELQDFEIEAH